MNIIETSISDVKLLAPRIFNDERGFFLESYNQKTFSELLHGTDPFVQDNHSRSIKNVLRGLHYQIKHPQGKLIYAVTGEIYDIVVDLRKSSPTFGKWNGSYLSDKNHYQLWVPPGFAHGFLVLSEIADVIYKTTDFYDPSSEYCLRWDDPDLAISWPLADLPILSTKDRRGFSLKDAVL